MNKARLSILLLIFVLNSCWYKSILPKNPCESHDLVNNLSNLSKKELYAIEYELKKRKIINLREKGCNEALLAKVSFYRGNMRDASNYFASSAKKLPRIAPYLLLAKAKIDVDFLNMSSSKHVLETLLKNYRGIYPRQYYWRINNLLLNIAIKEKDREQILKTHHDLMGQGFSQDEVFLFNIAQTMQSLGHKKRADEIYKKLLINFPKSEQAEKISKLANISLSLSEQERYFNNLIKNLSFQDLVEEADKICANGQYDIDQQAVWQSMATQALVMDHRYKEGLKRAKKFSPKASAIYLENQAWTLGKLNRPLEASDAYADLIRIANNPSTKTKACFFAGFSLYEAGYYSLARMSWEKCSSCMPNSTYFENFLWYQSFSSILEEDYYYALNKLSKLVKIFKNSQEINKYYYFLAYVLKNIGKNESAHNIFLSLKNKAQPDYYNLLASKAVETFPKKLEKINYPKYSLLASNDKYFLDGLALYGLGFMKEAKELILHSKENIKKKLIFFENTKDYYQASQLAGILDHGWQQKDNKINVLPTISSSYPKPYSRTVSYVANKYKLPQSLLYAIIKSESGFSEKAQSPRGALGLMQVMPNIAHSFARHLNLKRFRAHHLKIPETSIKIGGLMLATLKRQFGEPHLMVAAYNAGARQVTRWKDSFGHLPLPIFIERIPYKETRNYVKSVLNHESIYNALNGNDLRILL